VQPQNKATLTKILTYHVVPGVYTAQDLMALGGGVALHVGHVNFLALHFDGKRLAGDSGERPLSVVNAVLMP
jgi:uncharacterized surface protein with fasciclin (FAS1) repeats